MVILLSEVVGTAESLVHRGLVIHGLVVLLLQGI